MKSKILPRHSRSKILLRFPRSKILSRYPRLNSTSYQEIPDVEIKPKIFPRYSRIQGFLRILARCQTLGTALFDSNTVRSRFTKKILTIDNKIRFCGICIVMNNMLNRLDKLFRKKSFRKALIISRQHF